MTNGFHVKDYGQPVKRYVQTMDLKDDPELIAEYRRRHSKEESWHWPHSPVNRSGKTIWPSSSNVPKEPQAARNGR